MSDASGAIGEASFRSRRSTAPRECFARFIAAFPLWYWRCRAGRVRGDGSSTGSRPELVAGAAPRSHGLR
jgi:hypothetical protein